MRYLVIIFFISYSTASAQITACFTIDETSGCVPHTLNVTDCSGHIGPQYFYGTASPSTNTTYTFNEPGNYTVIQAVDNGGIFNFDTQYVNVFPVPAPIVELTQCGNNELFLEIDDIGYDYYVVDWNDGSMLDTILTSPTSTSHPYPNSNNRNVKIYGRYEPENCGHDTTITIQPISNFNKPNINTLKVLGDSAIELTIDVQSYVKYTLSTFTNGTLSSSSTIISGSNTLIDTVEGLNTLSNTYCFELIANNKCIASTVASSLSDKVCSVVLNANSQPGFNEVSWKSYTGDGAALYDLQRNQTLLNTFTTYPVFYNDSAIFCSQEYTYQLVTKTDSSISYSNETTVVGQSESSPTPVTDVYSTYDESNQLIISWKSVSKIPPAYYTINSTQATDTFLILNTVSNTCYSITYTDSCDNISQVSEKTCPIVLEGKQNDIFEIELNWNNYQTFTNGIDRYEISIYNHEKELISSIDNGLMLNYVYDITGTSNQIYYFRIKGYANDSLTTLSNQVKLTLLNRILVPNAFSPNNDGLNDIFIPKVRFAKEFKFAVYNKWGTSVFMSDNLKDGWDGGNSPSGVYTYVIEVTDFLGEQAVETGTVTLIR